MSAVEKRYNVWKEGLTAMYIYIFLSPNTEKILQQFCYTVDLYHNSVNVNILQ